MAFRGLEPLGDHNRNEVKHSRAALVTQQARFAKKPVVGAWSFVDSKADYGHSRTALRLNRCSFCDRRRPRCPELMDEEILSRNDEKSAVTVFQYCTSKIPGHCSRE